VPPMPEPMPWNAEVVVVSAVEADGKTGTVVQPEQPYQV